MHVDDALRIWSSTRVKNYIDGSVADEYAMTYSPWQKHLGFTLKGRLALAVDNKAAVHIVENQGVTGRTKHFQDQIHYVRYLFNLQRIAVKHVVTTLQRADGFTKALDKTKFAAWAPCVIR